MMAKTIVLAFIHLKQAFLCIIFSNRILYSDYLAEHPVGSHLHNKGKQMQPEIIASLIGTFITATAAIIVALIQKSPEKGSDPSPSLIVPQGYKTHDPQKRNLWFFVVPMAIVGGIAGYLLGTLFNIPPALTNPYTHFLNKVSQPTAVSPTVEITPQVVYAVVTETSEKNAWMATFPIAGTQINFAPNLPLGQNLDDVPTNYKMSPSPYSGIFLAHSGIDKVPTSWEVHYQGGEILPAQSEKCYINRGYSEMWQSPLNLTANESSTTVTIFADSRYSMIVKSIEVFVTNFAEPKTNSEIEYVKVLMPGAGGMGLPFQTVRANRVFVDKDLPVAYQIDFQDFILKPQEGVNIYVPLTFLSEGTYQLQFKIIGQAIPVYNGDKEGDFTLTTGRFSYGWINIKEPLDFKVEQEGSGTADLVSCP